MSGTAGIEPGYKIQNLYSTQIKLESEAGGRDMVSKIFERVSRPIGSGISGSDSY